MGYMLTLNYGLVDKRMKHLMKIRKRGKKLKRTQQQQQTAQQEPEQLQQQPAVAAEAGHEG